MSIRVYTAPLIETIRVGEKYGTPYSAILQLVFVAEDIVYICGMLSKRGNFWQIFRAFQAELKNRNVKEVRYFRYKKNGQRREVVRKL